MEDVRTKNKSTCRRVALHRNDAAVRGVGGRTRRGRRRTRRRRRRMKKRRRMRRRRRMRQGRARTPSLLKITHSAVARRAISTLTFRPTSGEKRRSTDKRKEEE
eukprot:2731488-Pyramimonas_sp.AAC.1